MILRSYETREKDLRRLFSQVDTDGDGMLGQSDLASLLAADHLQGENVQDVFADLTRRTEQTARVDWPTFRRHFRTKSTVDNPVEPLDRDIPGILMEAPAIAPGSVGRAPQAVAIHDLGAQRPQHWAPLVEMNAFVSEATGLFDCA